jgi:hypothetical protein
MSPNIASRFDGEPVMPPSARNFWYNGFNAQRMDFLGAPMFAPTFALGHQVIIRDFFGNDVTCLYPDHVAYDPTMNSQSYGFEKTLRFISDYSNTFGASVSASAKGFDLSFSGDTGFTYMGSLFADQSMYYELSFLVCKTGGFGIYGGPAPLNSGFAADLAKLEASAPRSPYDAAFTALFDKYGTHYCVRADTGGFFVLQCNIEKTVFTTKSAADIHGAFSVSVNDFFSSESLSASAFDKTSSLKSEIGDQMSTESTTKGGTPGGEEKDFFNSCIYQPTLLTLDLDGTCAKPTFRLISDFVSSEFKALIEEAIAIYSQPPSNSYFQRPLPVLVNGVQTMRTDGLLVMKATEQGDSMQIFVDSQPEPSTLVAQAVNQQAPDTVGGCVTTATALVRLGQNFIAATNRSPDDPLAASALFYPFNNVAQPGATVFKADRAAPLVWKTNSISGGYWAATVNPEGGFLSLPIQPSNSSGWGISASDLSMLYYYTMGSQSSTFVFPLMAWREMQFECDGMALPNSYTLTPLIKGIKFGDPSKLQPNVATPVSLDSICVYAIPATYGMMVSLRAGPSQDAVIGDAGARYELAGAAMGNNGVVRGVVFVPAGCVFYPLVESPAPGDIVGWIALIPVSAGNPIREVGSQRKTNVRDFVFPVNWSGEANDALLELPDGDRQPAKNEVNEFINQECTNWEPGQEEERTIAYKNYALDGTIQKSAGEEQFNVLMLKVVPKIQRHRKRNPNVVVAIVNWSGEATDALNELSEADRRPAKNMVNAFINSTCQGWASGQEEERGIAYKNYELNTKIQKAVAEQQFNVLELRVVPKTER